MIAMLALLLADAVPAQLSPTAAPSGQFFLNGGPVAQVNIEQITYLGDCPGEKITSLSPITFLAESVAPAPYQRILIQNQTTGGFTDREYDERRQQSQSFVMSLGQGQRGSFLTLAQGRNTFAWTVTNRVQNQVLGQGTASLDVTVSQRQQVRGFQSYKDDTYCLNERDKSLRTKLDDCKDGLYTLERIGLCPDGSKKTLSFQTLRRQQTKPFGSLF